jgi:hypothetical protein
MRNQHPEMPKKPNRRSPSVEPTRAELLLQPWFLPARISKRIRYLIPADFRRRLQDCFEDYGCFRCGRMDVPYKSNGMCLACMSLVFGRIQRSMWARSNERLTKRYGQEFMAKAAQAQKLLADFSAHRRGKVMGGRTQIIRLGNPVTETYARY